MAQICLYLIKTVNSQPHDTLYAQNTRHTKKTTPRHIIIKWLNTSNKEKVWKIVIFHRVEQRVEGKGTGKKKHN